MKRKNYIMKEMIGYCGLNCSSCPAFLATQNNDDIAREKTAVLFSEKFGLNLKPNKINCDGCLFVGGKLIRYCQSCEVRKCASAKCLHNCAYCDEQPCEKITHIMNYMRM